LWRAADLLWKKSFDTSFKQKTRRNKAMTNSEFAKKKQAEYLSKKRAQYVKSLNKGLKKAKKRHK
jgi:hypothetical protein